MAPRPPAALAATASPSNSPRSYPFADFFVPNLGNNPTPTPFVAIGLPSVLQNYNAEWFENFSGTPTDPDDDAMEQ